MSRVALAAGPDPGHCFPVLAVATALAEAGHEVIVLSGGQRRDDIVQTGVDFIELPLELPDPRHEDLGDRMWGMPGRLAPPTADVLKGFAPDVVVADTLTASAAFAAEILGVPWVEVIPHHLPDSDPAIPPIGLGRLPSSSLLRRRDDRLVFRRSEASVRAGQSQRAAVRQTLRLAGTGRPAARLVASLPSLEHPRSRWPSNTHLVGALDWDPPWTPLEPPPGDKPLVVVADSSANTVPWRLGPACLTGLRHTGVRLVVVTGDDLAPWPHDCVVGPAPHGPLFEQADVVVTPGGGGAIGKAAARGVPMVVVPIHGDQLESAARVVAAGAGVRVTPMRRRPGAVRRAVLRVLADERFRVAASALAEEARTRGPAFAAEIVAAVAAGARPVGVGPQR